uniref:Myb/SANT-like domain-containing protein n=1 Tax=Lactuca sativa TaxID=4236 RepID=A0A9R1W3X5_LACSA|nr:hypothetical protein LSAT_V11C300107070 [Lactuca sativa]
MFRGISLTGFGWNAQTQLIEANDQVWDHLIKVSFRLMFYIEDFDKMLVLFARDTTSGKHVETTKEKNARLSKTADIKIESIEKFDDLLASNDVTLEIYE